MKVVDRAMSSCARCACRLGKRCLSHFEPELLNGQLQEKEDKIAELEEVNAQLMDLLKENNIEFPPNH